jgi:hypothetical protein
METSEYMLTNINGKTVLKQRVVFDRTHVEALGSLKDNKRIVLKEIPTFPDLKTKGPYITRRSFIDLVDYGLATIKKEGEKAVFELSEEGNEFLSGTYEVPAYLLLNACKNIVEISEQKISISTVH